MRRALRVVLLVTPPPFHALAELERHLYGLRKLSDQWYFDAFHTDDLTESGRLAGMADEADVDSLGLFLSCSTDALFYASA